MNIEKHVLLSLVAVVGAAVALPASAAITVGNTSISSPVAATGFETMPPVVFAGVDYIDGGVVVRGVGDEGGQNNIGFQLSDPQGVGSWGTIDATGYTDAKLQSGGTFNSFSGFFGSEGFSPVPAELIATFFLGGVLVGTADGGPLALTGQTISFFGFTADEVQFSGASPFAANKNRIGVDDLAFGASVAGVPEPASWALLISGFGMAGATLRRRRAVALAARA